MSSQPIASEEVAGYLVALVELGPIARTAQMGGPEGLSSETLARTYVQARGCAP